MFHKILVPLDTTDVNEHILNAAIALAKGMGAELHLLHVLSDADKKYPSSASLPGMDVGSPYLTATILSQRIKDWEEYKRQNLQILHSLANQAIAFGIKTEVEQLFGNTGSIICQVAQAEQFDLIIMGRRGHKGLNELFLGSVSNYVLHHAPCSVLTIQGQNESSSENSDAQKEVLKLKTNCPQFS